MINRLRRWIPMWLARVGRVCPHRADWPSSMPEAADWGQIRSASRRKRLSRNGGSTLPRRIWRRWACIEVNR